jgi:uncharacterized protein YqgC (DUF456 family)
MIFIIVAVDVAAVFLIVPVVPVVLVVLVDVIFYLRGIIKCACISGWVGTWVSYDKATFT